MIGWGTITYVALIALAFLLGRRSATRGKVREGQSNPPRSRIEDAAEPSEFNSFWQVWP